MQIPPHLIERLKQLSASRIADYLRSRPWLSGTTAVCLVLLLLIVWFQPADDAIVADNEDLENWPDVELGEFTAAPAALPEIEPRPTRTSSEGPAAETAHPWGTVRAIPTVARERHNDIQPVHAEPFRRRPTPPAWLTGTIEELPEASAGMRRFDAFRSKASTLTR